MAANANKSNLVTESEIRDARDYIVTQDLYVRTPLLKNVQNMFSQVTEQKVELYMKLENMQNTGSFKIRGVLNQMMKRMETAVKPEEKKIPITMSAGNYGKAFGTYLQSRGIKGCCIIPDTAPTSRVGLIKSLGVDVEQKPTFELQDTVDKYVSSGSHIFFPPFDDRHLISGYASVGLEILEEVSDPDVVLVCCGGGGIVSGVAAAIKTVGPSRCRVYAVEPKGAPCMYESMKAGRAVSLPVNTLATGLGPPFAGKLTYQHCAEFLESVLLVSDEEIVRCVELLYKRGLVVEPSGAAAMAALVFGHVPDVAGKKVVVVITGGNFTPEEMHALLSNTTGKK